MNDRQTWFTNDRWQAAYLLLLGIALDHVSVDTSGRATWYFNNRDEAAYRAAVEFRSAGVATVPLLEFRHAFQTVLSAADAARRDDSREFATH